MNIIKLEEVKNEIKKINEYLNKCLWMDFELSIINGNNIVLSGSIDTSKNDYEIDILFENPYYISSLLSWKVDTKKKFIKLVEFEEEFEINTRYKVEDGSYIFRIFPEDYDETPFYIVAKKIICNIINDTPF